MNQNNYVRVSEIISFYGNLGKCINCGEGKSQIPQGILQRKCQIGTNVHETIEMYLKDMDYPPEDEHVRPYFESFKLWNEDAKIEPIVQEVRLYDNKLMLTGQIDCIANIRDKKMVLIDFKTSSKADKESWEMQGAFYYLLAKGQWDVSREIIFVHLMKDGKKAKEVIINLTDNVLDEVMCLYKIFKKKNAHRFV